MRGDYVVVTPNGPRHAGDVRAFISNPAGPRPWFVKGPSAPIIAIGYHILTWSGPGAPVAIVLYHGARGPGLGAPGPVVVTSGNY